MTRSKVDRGFALLLIACLAVGGCTAIGYSVGKDLGDQRWGRPVATGDAETIALGTPVQVGLPDGGSVRGLWLGTTTLADKAEAPSRGALRLGVGNRMFLDRVFESGRRLEGLTREQVPDTLVFAYDGITELRVPGSDKSGVKGAAVGAAADISIVTILLVVTLGGLALLLARGH